MYTNLSEEIGLLLSEKKVGKLPDDNIFSLKDFKKSSVDRYMERPSAVEMENTVF